MNAFLSEEILEWLTSPHETEIDALLAAALDDYESLIVSSGAPGQSMKGEELANSVTRTISPDSYS